MPLIRTTVKGEPAYKYGATGKAYPYKAGNTVSREAARKKAIKQALAIQYRNGKPAHL
jgi:hypothetical protein